MLTHVHKRSTLGGWQVGSKGEVKRLGSTAVGAADAASDAQAGASAAASHAEYFGHRSGCSCVRAADASAVTVDVTRFLLPGA